MNTELERKINLLTAIKGFYHLAILEDFQSLESFSELKKDPEKVYIEEVLGIKSFDLEIYNNEDSKIISKMMPQKYNWFVGDNFTDIMYDHAVKQEITEELIEKLDKELIELYESFKLFRELHELRKDKRPNSIFMVTTLNKDTSIFDQKFFYNIDDAENFADDELDDPALFDKTVVIKEKEIEG